MQCDMFGSTGKNWSKVAFASNMFLLHFEGYKTRRYNSRESGSVYNNGTSYRYVIYLSYKSSTFFHGLLL